MIYIVMLATFIIFSFVSKEKDVKKLTNVFYFVLLLFAGLRFGIGTDYFNYYNGYYVFLSDSFSDLFFQRILILRIEPGFGILMSFFKLLKLPYTYFIAFCSFITLSLIFYTIKKYSVNKNISLLFFFANYYMIYVESALRQGIAMAIFIYAFYSLINDKKKLKFYLLIMLGMNFHVSIVIAILIPIIDKIDRITFLNPISLMLIILIAFSCSLFLPKILLTISSLVFNRGASYARVGINFNIFAILSRLMQFVLIYKIFVKSHNYLSKGETLAVKVYLSSIIIYFFISSISVLSRLSNNLMFLEIIAIPNLFVYLGKKEKRLYQVIFIAIFSLLLIKNINSFLYQRDYNSKNILDYKHITIFNKEEIQKIMPESISARYFINKGL